MWFSAMCSRHDLIPALCPNFFSCLLFEDVRSSLCFLLRPLYPLSFPCLFLEDVVSLCFLLRPRYPLLVAARRFPSQSPLSLPIRHPCLSSLVAEVAWLLLFVVVGRMCQRCSLSGSRTLLGFIADRVHCSVRKPSLASLLIVSDHQVSLTARRFVNSCFNLGGCSSLSLAVPAVITHSPPLPVFFGRRPNFSSW